LRAERGKVIVHGCVAHAVILRGRRLPRLRRRYCPWLAGEKK
jgi:hypothetical protein